MKRHHFTALPFHEPPRHLESFTGYLSWIACTNEMSSLVEMAHICYPMYPNSIITNGLNDFPPLSLSTLCTTLVCNEKRLLATTFYFLALKFGRTTQPRQLGKFLSGSLSSRLRYCPLCINEKGYYNLLWRFTELVGCAAHGCKLLDACHNPDCALALPFWSTSPPGECPSCRFSLADAPVEPLTPGEYESVRKLASSLKFLLSPPGGKLQPGLDKESSLAVTQQIGNRLRLARERRGWTREAVAELTGFAYYQIRGAENGKIHHQGASFQTYLHCAQCLDIPLAALVAENIWNQWSVRHPGISKLLDANIKNESVETNESRLLRGVEGAITRLQHSGASVNQQSVCAQMGLSRKYLMQDTAVKAKLLELPYIRVKKRVGCVTYQEREEAYLARVRSAIEELQRADIPLTRAAIAQKVGYSTPGLCYYQRIKSLFDEIIPTTKEALAKRKDARVEIILLLITDAAKTISHKGNRVTAKAICSEAGLARANLMRYPEVAARIHQLVGEYAVDKSVIRLAREKELRSRVEGVIEDLRGKGLPVTQRAISRTMCLSVAGLLRYPSVRMLLDEV
jgi:transcriptional regulator with XRE-family HTH domain